jgi:hypothetical protein
VTFTLPPEPASEEWTDEATGYRCYIYRHPTLLHLCGYVRVPDDHPWNGHDYGHPTCGHPGCYDHSIDTAVSVHGGITFANRGPGELPEEEGWWFGFDCAHLGDLVPGYPEGINDRDVYRDFEYVKDQCGRLAAQLKEST